MLAVPVPRTREALESLRPHLGPDQVVLDVGSVKVHPYADLEAVLGDEIPWVATHPLFGPLSLALAERPLRVVVCPSPRHPGPLRAPSELYRRIGCEVIEQTPESHDRVMAHTHALTFFVAKGMLDAGAGMEVPFAPPSFQAISRTIETVRSDAGHLFAAIQRRTPSPPRPGTSCSRRWRGSTRRSRPRPSPARRRPRASPSPTWAHAPRSSRRHGS